MDILTQLAEAIKRVEGYAPGTRAYRNNNPGNIWDGTGNGKTQRIWPNLPIDDKGFVIYPSYQAGYAALLNDLKIKVNRGMTLEQLITMYAPPNENDTAGYIAMVAQQTGLPANVPLNALDQQPATPDYPGETQFPGFLPIAAAGGSILPGVDDWMVLAAVGGLVVLVMVMWDRG